MAGESGQEFEGGGKQWGGRYFYMFGGVFVCVCVAGGRGGGGGAGRVDRMNMMECLGGHQVTVFSN